MQNFLQNKKPIWSTFFYDMFQQVGPDTNNIMLLKFPKITSEIKNHLDNEIIFLHSHKHPSLSKFKDFHCSPDSSYFTLENSNELLLTAYINQKGVFAENEAISLIFSIIQVYDLFKKEKMPLRDFSLDNIYLNSVDPKVIILDLGLYYTFNMFQKDSSIIHYGKPPEKYFQDKFITDGSEVWSLGIIFFYMIYGNLPWRGKSEAGYFGAVRDIPLKIPKEKRQINIKTLELITKMLNFDYNKRINWHELINNGIFDDFRMKSEKNTDLLKSPENKWKYNIFSFYCKNDFILKNSFSLNEKKKESKFISQNKKQPLANYPNLDDNAKSISECQNYQMLISANLHMKKSDEEQFKAMEEKRIIEIDQIIQKLIDNEKMHFSLKNNDNYQFQEKDIKNSSLKSLPLKSSFKESIYMGKSFIKPQSIVEEKPLKAIYEENIMLIQNQLEKYNVFGKTIGDSELVFRKIVDLELWRIQRFLLLKKLIKFRLSFYKAFNENQNIMDLENWIEFKNSEQFIGFMNKLQKENDFLQKDLEKLYRKTVKSLKKFELNENNKIEKFLNLDLTQNFDSLLFIILYLHIKTINPKVEVALKYNDLDKAIKLLMHKAEIIDCLIISELQFLVDIPDFFNLNEFQTVINSLNYDLLRNYADKKEKILENWKVKYIY